MAMEAKEIAEQAWNRHKGGQREQIPQNCVCARDGIISKYIFKILFCFFLNWNIASFVELVVNYAEAGGAVYSSSSNL